VKQREIKILSGISVTGILKNLRVVPASVVFSRTREVNLGEQLKSPNLAWTSKHTAITND
jgi:hypothetical protein